MSLRTPYLKALRTLVLGFLSLRSLVLLSHGLGLGLKV